MLSKMMLCSRVVSSLSQARLPCIGCLPAKNQQSERGATQSSGGKAPNFQCHVLTIPTSLP